MRSVLLVLFLLLMLSAEALGQELVTVTVITDEAEAVLNILDKRFRKLEITENDWKHVFESEAYRRLKKREFSLSRKFEDPEFRTFVMSDELLQRREPLRQTLAKLREVDPRGAGKRALAYLPVNASINAKIYPVIKPQTNSFVFEVRTDPAIFIYLDPKVTPEKFENTLGHELHHIGFGTACPAPASAARIEKLGAGAKRAINWLGAFGEGIAMLAASGGPNAHPHSVSDPEERAQWDSSLKSLDEDLRRIESFLLRVVSGELSGDAETKAAFEFFGVQGPWYTVGWKMAVTIEKAFGRQKLIDAFCENDLLLKTYNDALMKLQDGSAKWSDRLLKELS